MSRTLLLTALIVTPLLTAGCGSREVPEDEDAATPEADATATEEAPTPPPPPVTEADLDAARALVQRAYDLAKEGDCDTLRGLMAEAMSAEECQTWIDRVEENELVLAEVGEAVAPADPADPIEIKIKLDSTKAQDQPLTVRVARRGDDWKLMR